MIEERMKAEPGANEREMSCERSTGAARPFPLARLTLAVIVPIIVYASLRPFHGWRRPALGPLSMLDWNPGSTTAFDMILNVVGYVPLGLCLALALYPRLRGARAFAVGAAVPALGSVLVEVLQVYLPGRMPSLWDVAMNVLGAIAGAALAVRMTAWLADHRGGGRHLRERWLVPGHLAEAGLIVLAAWFVALFAQRTLLFGSGDWRGNLQVSVDWSVAPLVYFATEVFVVAANLAAAGVVLRLVLADKAPRRALLLALVGAALLLRLIAQIAFWEKQAVWQWISPPNVLGVVLGWALARAAFAVPARTAALGAIALLVAAVAVVNIAPPDPAWWLRSPKREVMLIGLALVARYTSKGWPLAALVFLWLAMRRAGRVPQARAG